MATRTKKGVDRSSISGRFVKKKYGKTHPKTTENEVKKKTGK